MDSTVSSGPSASLKTAARAAAEGAVVAIAVWLIATRVWRAESRSISVGAAAAWAASSLSIAWLKWAIGKSMKTFWWAFGGGMALRAAVLAGLAVWVHGRNDFSLEAVLISYVFILMTLLLTLELRHLKIR